LAETEHKLPQDGKIVKSFVSWLVKRRSWREDDFGCHPIAYRLGWSVKSKTGIEKVFQSRPLVASTSAFLNTDHSARSVIGSKSTDVWNIYWLVGSSVLTEKSYA